jgi:hypothetical protein
MSFLDFKEMEYDRFSEYFVIFSLPPTSGYSPTLKSHGDRTSNRMWNVKYSTEIEI